MLQSIKILGLLASAGTVQTTVATSNFKINVPEVPNPLASVAGGAQAFRSTTSHPPEPVPKLRELDPVTGIPVDVPQEWCGHL